MTKTHIVWFKNDLRVHDHAPLAAACTSGDPVLALYIFEPELWSGPDGTAGDIAFLKESLSELAEALEERGADLVIRIGAPAEIFAQLHRDHGVAAIHTYRESRQNNQQESRDAVRRWALRAGVSVREQEGHRQLSHAGTPGDWRARWHSFMTAPRRMAPEFIFSASARSESLDDIQEGRFQENNEALALPGGRTHAVRLLRRAFIAGDAQTFRDVVRALKQHIGIGAISVREAVQAAMRAERIGAPGESVTYAKTLIDRLRDECERQYRLERRFTHQQFGRQGHSAPLQHRERVRPNGTSIGRRSIQMPSDMGRLPGQLSFDFDTPRQAS